MVRRQDKLWSELTREEKREERREFLASYEAERGPGDYRMLWEQFLSQEGWTERDERIMMMRDSRFGGER